MDFLLDFDESKSAQEQQQTSESNHWSVANGPAGSLPADQTVPVWEEEVDSDPGSDPGNKMLFS